MAIAFTIGGARTVIPGVYDTFRVANSLPAPAPAGRSILILGESSEGVPGAELDLRLNFFTDFQSVRDFYRSGPIVDAARMAFSNQPSPAFPGSISRLYVYKTNDSTRAERELEGPAGYGDIVAARFGEESNLIKTQIVDAQSETLPSKTFSYLPSSSARSLRVVANGVLNSGIAISAGQTAADVQAALDALTDISATGGTSKLLLDAAGTMDMSLAQTDDTLTLTKTSGDDFNSSIATGDILYIAPGSALAGASDENAGSWYIMSATSTVISMRQLHADQANASLAFDTTAVAAVADADVEINSAITIQYTGSSKVGSGATLEILEDVGDQAGAGYLLVWEDFSNLLANGTSTIANISATVPSTGKLSVALDTGSWSTTPAVGDLVYIGRGSVLEGATGLNVGTYIVESSSAQTLTMSHLYSGMTTEAVASVLLDGANDTLLWAQGFVSSNVSARRIDSEAERKVRVEASRESDGSSLPDNSIGGNPVLEIGYYQAGTTAATLTINTKREMIITPSGAGDTITVLLNKYSSLGELVTFLNTRTGIYARVAQSSFQSLSTRSLDMVTDLDIMNGQETPAYNGRIKKDYTDWVTFFVNNFGLITFRAGNLATFAGLPDSEAGAQFLDGAAIGSTSSASIQAGLDAGLKVDVRNVVPLFSRDASKDVSDGLTDAGSTYSIDAIHAAVRSHVATASSTLFRRERFGMLSHYGSFDDSKTKAADVSFERCQMTFQLHRATDGEGNLVRFLPWMSALAVATGRSQASLGTPMLRKPFLLSSAEHIGDLSLFSDSLEPDFDPESRGQLEEAIEAGLLVFNAVPGFGVRLEGPDNTTRSRVNDPQAWLYERASVFFTADEVRQTIRSVLENYIGQNQIQVPQTIVSQSITDALGTFLPGTGNGALLAGRVTKVKRVGTTYRCEVQIQPVEAIEAITVDVLATRNLA